MKQPDRKFGRKSHYPTDIFGNDLEVGEKIVYITHQYGATTLNWAKITNIHERERQYHTHGVYVISVKRYGGIIDRLKLPGILRTVYLTNPTVLKVGQTIPDLE